ncbi:hypothetical protein [Aggregatilinea lenta]|uniref:hypothetical protein n=1 Tax=Aggregatilinea lenta TaxID=913108 RepID=UPI000E5B4C2D|nr:hypothetical protein [Aggregatilinea lenta]
MTKDTITLPASTLEKFSQLAQLLEQAGRLAREISQEKVRLAADSQAWYWSEPWQVMEREADDALAEGDYREFDNAEALIADLHAHV